MDYPYIWRDLSLSWMGEQCMFLWVHMYVQIYLQVCLCMWSPEISLLRNFGNFFLRQSFSLAWNSSNSQVAWSSSPRDLPFPQYWDYKPMQLSWAFLCGFWGTNAGSHDAWKILNRISHHPSSPPWFISSFISAMDLWGFFPWSHSAFYPTQGDYRNS